GDFLQTAECVRVWVRLQVVRACTVAAEEGHHLRPLDESVVCCHDLMVPQPPGFYTGKLHPIFQRSTISGVLDGEAGVVALAGPEVAPAVVVQLETTAVAVGTGHVAPLRVQRTAVDERELPFRGSPRLPHE